MKNRFEQIDDFLKYIASIIHDNPTLELTDAKMHNFVFSEITKIGVVRDSDVDFSKMSFQRLSSYFEDRRNINTFIDPKYNYYLELYNNEQEAFSYKEAITMYIPQRGAYLDRSARIIFDYLDNSNMVHISRIAKDERNDNIFIKVFNKNDAVKLLNFLSGDKQVQAGLIEANPFIYRENGIAVFCDRENSYLSVITDLICTYLRAKIINNDLTSVDSFDFLYFTEKYYNHHFVSLNDLGEVIADFNLNGTEINNTFNNKIVCNIGNIIHLFIIGLNGNFDINEFYRQYEIRNNEGFIINQANMAGKKRYFPNQIEASDYIGTIDNLFLEAIDYFKEKYHYDDNKAVEIISDFLDDGRLEHITRDEGYRDKFAKSEFKTKMPRILRLANMDIYEYYITKSKVRSIKCLKDAIYETYVKYETRYEEGFEKIDGYTQAASALSAYLKEGRPEWFTRDNNGRFYLIKYCTKDLAREAIKNHYEKDINYEDSNLVREICNKYVKEVVSSRRVEHLNSGY